MSDIDDDADIETQILDGDILVIILRDGLDATTSLQFESEVLTHLEAGHSKIIIDCRHLGIFPAWASGRWFGCRRDCARRGARSNSLPCRER
jgi:hypothetical protein